MRGGAGTAAGNAGLGEEAAMAEIAAGRAETREGEDSGEGRAEQRRTRGLWNGRGDEARMLAIAGLPRRRTAGLRGELGRECEDGRRAAGAGASMGLAAGLGAGTSTAGVML